MKLLRFISIIIVMPSVTLRSQPPFVPGLEREGMETVAGVVLISEVVLSVIRRRELLSFFTLGSVRVGRDRGFKQRLGDLFRSFRFDASGRVTASVSHARPDPIRTQKWYPLDLPWIGVWRFGMQASA